MIRPHSCSRLRPLDETARVILLAATFLVVGIPARAQGTVVTDDDGRATAADCDAGALAFGSIQAAVDAAASGDSVLICPGTYDEQVVVGTSDLTIHGAGAGATVLRPTVVAQNTVRPGTTHPVAPILLVDGASGVRVSGLTIDGSEADGGASIFPTCSGIPFYVGIFYRNSSGIIDTTHVTQTMSAAYCAMGILGYSGAGGSVDLTVTDSLVDDYGVGGIICLGRGTTCSLIGNAIRGRGPVDDQLQSGISIRTGAAAVITGNVITDHVFAPGHGVPESSAGISLFFADPSSNPHLLRDNVFAGNQVDVQRSGTEATLFH